MPVASASSSILAMVLGFEDCPLLADVFLSSTPSSTVTRTNELKLKPRTILHMVDLSSSLT
jgi:hypothetical protein